MASKWEPHKEVIKELYMDKGLPLDKVMDIMKGNGFYASKDGYEMQLRRWRFKKNCKHADLKIVKARYATVVQHGVKFDIRFGGKRLDEPRLKKFDRCLIPVSEKYNLERSRLPEKWAIIPRVSKLYLSSVTTKQLPWEVFQIQFDSFANTCGFIDMPLQMRQLVIPTLRREASSLVCKHHSKVIEDIFHNLSAVLPVAEDAEIESLLWQLIGGDSSNATAQFLKLATYFLSNKLLEDDKEKFCQVNDELFEWFKLGNNHRLLRNILSSRTPTIDALAEGLFSSSLRAEDQAFSRMFLESGLNPDIMLTYGEFYGRSGRKSYFSSTPLQMMVRRSNICLIELLFEFNANPNYTSDKPVLLVAIEAGNLEIARLLISKGAFVNPARNSWPTPLQAALGAGDVGMVRLLLDAGADVNLSSGDSKRMFVECPLWRAITSGVKTLVDMLLECGAELNPEDANRIGTPLQRAIRMDNETEARRLLELGENVNAPAGEWDGRTALQEAAEKGDLALCQVLIQAGADVNAAPALPPRPRSRSCPRSSYLHESGTKGVTALVAAVFSKNHQLVKFLVDSGADVNATISAQIDDEKHTALALATSLDDVEIVQYLMLAGADAGRDGSIFCAVGERRAELIPVLVAAGANIHQKDPFGDNLLDKVVEREDLDMIRFLLNCGAHPGPHALPEAAERGNIGAVQLLIEAGADLNAYGSWGRNALQAAALGGHVDVVTYLLDKGADVNWPAAGFHGTTALQAAVRRNSLPLVRLLLAAGANADDEPATYGCSSVQEAAEIGADDLIHILLHHGAIINEPVERMFGSTALQAAAMNGHYQTVQLLLTEGAHVNAPASEYGFTALQAAASRGFMRIAKALIVAKADIDARSGSKRRTALESAAERGRIDMLKLLLNAGANITTCNGRRQLRNALSYATKYGHDAAAKFLECHQISEGI